MEDKEMRDVEKVQGWVHKTGIRGEVVRVEKVRLEMVRGDASREDAVYLVAEEEMDEEWIDEVRYKYPEVIITSCYPI